jgi:LysM repeat protein
MVYGQTGGELLQNPNFTNYYGIGGANVVPVGWKLTSNLPVSSASHSYIYDGPVEYPGQPSTGQAWELSAQSAHFTAIGYQHVTGIPAGTKLHFSVYGNVYTCNKDNSCIENGLSYRVSDKSSGALERVGIDPTGGTDPGSLNIQWSPFIAPFDVYRPISINAAVTGDNGATVFLFATQANSMLLDSAYWYGASLQAVGTVAPTNAPTVTNAIPPTAPVVTPQVAQPDGSIVHTVMAGDTLSTIAYAYKTTVAQIQQLNNRDPGNTFLQVGQKLLIKPAKTAIPSPTPIPTLVAEVHPTITLQPGLDATATVRPTVIMTATVDAVAPVPSPFNSALWSGAMVDSPARLAIVIVVSGAISILLVIAGLIAGLLFTLRLK